MKSGAKASTAVIAKMVPFLLIVLSYSTGAHAQIRLGLLGGIHSSNVLETNHLPGWDTTTKKYNGSRMGMQLGVILDIPIGHKGFYFQPAITYTSKGRKYAKTNDSLTTLKTDTVYNHQSLNLGYIEIPLNLTYKIPLTTNKQNSFFISAGPYVDFFYNGNTTTESLTQSTNKFASETDPVSVGKGANTYKTADLGVNARTGFELGNVMVSAYYSRGLTSFYTASYTGTFHHELLGVSLGIWLSSTNKPPRPPKKDTDKDGIPDDQDMCPLQPGTTQWNGCPVPDTDHDGIDDAHDSCRTLPGLARYNGCPIPDSDGDGVNDEEDKCPHQIGLARYNGCPIPDRDGDGVNDEEDHCPDSAGPVENHGCPIVVVKEIEKATTEKINFIAKNILFTRASDQLTDSSFKALDQLAGILAANPGWHLTIEGHTDNEGTPERNLRLSDKRATAVKNYLVSKGLATTRLTAIGMGQENPIANNRTAAGRMANRRVELKLSIEK
ncbi:MAG TPA: OmpA family protein [Puia sp.]|jgi:outer membrane protein OmpA-like peptidoglycan-associated protein